MQEFAIINYALPIFLLVASILAMGQPKTTNAPSIILIGAWIVVLMIHGAVSAFKVSPLYPSSMTANIIIVTSVLSLAWSIVLWQSLLLNSTRGVRSTAKNNHFEFVYVMPQWTLWVMALYSASVLFLLHRAASNIVGARDVIGSLQLLRSELNYGGASWGGLEYAALPTIVFSAYSMIVTQGYSFVRRVPFYLTLCFATGFAVISTQRTIIFMLLIALAFAGSKKSLPTARAALALLSFMIIAFLFVGFFVGKIGSKDASTMEVLQSGLDSFLLYFLTPISAFDASQIWENPPMDVGYTMRFFQKTLDWIGIDTGNAKSLVMDFINVPSPTNVYTFTLVPISDFGPYISVAYFFVIGFPLGLVYLLPRRIPAVRVLQGFCYYPLAMTLYQDQFLTITSSWIQILFVLFCCHMLTHKRPSNVVA